MADKKLAATNFVSLGLRLYQHNPFVCYVLIKDHKGSTDATSGLFVSGLPLGLQKESTLAAVLSCFGPVASVVLHGSKRSAMVVFVESQARQAAIKAAAQGVIVEFEGGIEQYSSSTVEDEEEEAAGLGPSSARGLRAWVLQHKAQRPGNQELQKQLDKWTAWHEEEEARKERERQAAMAGDGWTVVVRSKGRRKASESGGISMQSGGVAVAAAQAAAAAKAAQPVEDFYRFQQREKRRSELLDLRQKFMEDRARIQELRAARNFKPF